MQAYQTSPPNLPSEPGVVKLSDEERQSGKWSRDNMQRAVELMHRDGLLVVQGVVDTAHLELIRESMLKTAGEIREAKTKVSDFNHGVRSNFLQAPPLSTPALLFDDVYANDFVLQIVEKYLGDGLRTPFITANVALSNTTQRQPVHKDASLVHPSCPYLVVCNWLLSDFTPENGSTEFWLGSHAQTLPVDQYWASPEAPFPTCNVRHELLEARRAVRPPAQVTVPFGSVLIRDPRTWHAGMPNPSDEDRIMVGIAYQSNWFPPHRRLKAPESARAILTSNERVETLADFYPDEQWDSFAQKWGPGEEMFLTYRPDLEGWKTTNDIEPHQKVITPS